MVIVLDEELFQRDRRISAILETSEAQIPEGASVRGIGEMEEADLVEGEEGFEGGGNDADLLSTEVDGSLPRESMYGSTKISTC